MIVFAFLFVDLFDTLGTLIGVSSKAGFLDKEGKLPRIKGALFADAVGTTAGAMLGTSTVTTFVESASGVADGGRTGLTSFTAGILFLVALIFTPIISAKKTSAKFLSGLLKSVGKGIEELEDFLFLIMQSNPYGVAMPPD